MKPVDAVQAYADRMLTTTGATHIHRAILRESRLEYYQLWSEPGFVRMRGVQITRVEQGLIIACATGNATFSKLKLKRGALDKFRLPVDVKEGL